MWFTVNKIKENKHRTIIAWGISTDLITLLYTNAVYQLHVLKNLHDYVCLTMVFKLRYGY